MNNQQIYYDSQTIKYSPHDIYLWGFDTTCEYYYDLDHMILKKPLEGPYNPGVFLKIRFKFSGTIYDYNHKKDDESTVKIELVLFEDSKKITLNYEMTNGIAKDWTAYTEIWVPFDFAKQKESQNPITSKWKYFYDDPAISIPIKYKLYKNDNAQQFNWVVGQSAYPTKHYPMYIDEPSIKPEGYGVSGSNIFYKRPYYLNITIPEAMGDTYAKITHKELINNDEENVALTAGEVNQISFTFNEDSFDETVEETRLDSIKESMTFELYEEIHYEVRLPLSSFDPDPPADAYSIVDPIMGIDIFVWNDYTYRYTPYVGAELKVPSYRPQISLTLFEVEHSYPQMVEPNNTFDLYDVMPSNGEYISDPEGGENVYFGYNKGISRIHYTLNLDNDIYGASIEYSIDLQSGTNPRRFRTFSETDGYIDFGDFEEIQDGECIRLHIDAIDSRGIPALNLYSKTLSVVNYNPPVLNNADVFRCDEAGNKKANGDYVGVDCSASLGNAYIGYYNTEINNELFSLIKYRKYNSGEEYISEQLLINQTNVFQLSSLYTYDFVIEVHDYIAQTIIRNFKVSTGIVALHIKKNGKGAAFGKICTDIAATDNCLDSAWNISSDKTIRSVGGFFYGENNTSASNKLLLNDHFVVGDSKYVSKADNTILCSIELPVEGLYFLCIGQVRNDNSGRSGRITTYMSHSGAPIFGIKQTGYLYDNIAGISCQYIVPNIVQDGVGTTVNLLVTNQFETAGESKFYGMLTCIRLV